MLCNVTDWNGQNISKPAAGLIHKTIGEINLTSNEDTIENIVRNNPEQYLFRPENTEKPSLIISENKLSVAEDRILTDDDDDASEAETIVYVPKQNATSFVEILEEPIQLTPDFSEDDNSPVSSIEDFFGQLSNDKESTHSISTTTKSTTKLPTTSTSATEATTTLSTSTKTTATTATTSSTTTSTSASFGIKSFFDKLSQVSISSTSSGLATSTKPSFIKPSKIDTLQELRVSKGTNKSENKLPPPENESNEKQNKTVGKVVQDKSEDNNDDKADTDEHHNLLGTHKAKNDSVLEEKEEIITTIEDLVEETTLFTITNDSVLDKDTEIVTDEVEIANTTTTTTEQPSTTRRLPFRTRTRRPQKRPKPTEDSNVINHNMNLQTALIINTLSKVLPMVAQSRLKNQPRLESVGSGVTFHQEEIFIFHTTLTELYVRLV